MNNNYFRSVDDICKSPFWQNGSINKSKEKSRILLSSRIEDMIYKDLHKNDLNNDLVDLEKKGLEKLNSFPSLIQDVFQSIYCIQLKYSDESELTANARIFNQEIIKQVLSSEEYPAFKVLCEGRDLPAYEAVKEFSEQIFGKLDELLNAANGASEKENAEMLALLNKMENQQEMQVQQIKDQIEQFENDCLDEKAEEKLLKTANGVARKQEQIENIENMIKQNIYKSKEFFQTSVTSAVHAAKEAAECAESILSSWGLEGSNPQAIKHNAELLKRVKENDKIKSIAKYLGKYREILDNTRKNNFAFGRGDKYDIVLGNNYTRAVSSEYTYLVLPETIPLFIQKVQRKALKQYRKRERISKGHGNVVICLDESGSTKGEPIAFEMSFL